MKPFHAQGGMSPYDAMTLVLSMGCYIVLRARSWSASCPQLNVVVNKAIQNKA